MHTCHFTRVSFRWNLFSSPPSKVQFQNAMRVWRTSLAVKSFCIRSRCSKGGKMISNGILKMLRLENILFACVRINDNVSCVIIKFWLEDTSSIWILNRFIKIRSISSRKYVHYISPSTTKTNIQFTANLILYNYQNFDMSISASGSNLSQDVEILR